MTRSRSLAQDVSLREVWAWAMFDFANSGYTTVVITAVFNAYFVAVVAGNAAWATFAWTAALSLSYALILVTAPMLGAYTDLRAARKRLLSGWRCWSSPTSVSVPARTSSPRSCPSSRKARPWGESRGGAGVSATS